MQYVIPIPEQVRDDSRESPFLYIILLFIIKSLQGYVFILLVCVAFTNSFSSSSLHAYYLLAETKKSSNCLRT